jgi:hypothetical protein
LSSLMRTLHSHDLIYISNELPKIFGDQNITLFNTQLPAFCLCVLFTANSLLNTYCCTSCT